MRFTFTVEVELHDADARFFTSEEPLEAQVYDMLQQGLDYYSSNVSDETFDDEGRMGVNFTVTATEGTTT